MQDMQDNSCKTYIILQFVFNIINENIKKSRFELKAGIMCQYVVLHSHIHVTGLLSSNRNSRLERPLHRLFVDWVGRYNVLKTHQLVSV